MYNINFIKLFQYVLSQLNGLRVLILNIESNCSVYS
jgi:hypothetical protein